MANQITLRRRSAALGVGERFEHALVKRRMEMVFLFFLLAVMVLAGRLAVLQVGQADEFAERAEKMTTRTFSVVARRGSILDRHGYGLADDMPAKAVAINPRVVKDPAATAERLRSILRLQPTDREAMQRAIERGKARRQPYLRLRRGVDRKVAEYALKLSRKDPLIKTLSLEDTPRRVNPAGRDAIQLVGAVNMDGQGIEGFELSLNKVLAGKDGERRVRVSAAGDPIPESETRKIDPVDGRDVKLTLDRDIQHAVEGHVLQVAREQSPDAVTAIVMDVSTGDILGMANYPSFAPGDKDVSPAQRRNRAITDLFEPGSIFKVLTAAAALEHGVNTHTYCSGRRQIGKWNVGCAHGSVHGAVSLDRMVEVSCNLGAGQLAERVGPRRMHEFLSRMGLQSKTGVEFPGEETGRMLKPEEWKTLRTVTIGFGQGIVVTPIQLLTAYSAIANDGVYTPPRLVLEAPGLKREERKPRRVMSAEKARKLRQAMALVVTGSRGTGKKAKIAGFSVAGKTGTAQIARNGRYGAGYVASFAGFLPVQKPRIAILVSVWHPRRGQYGGTVAAPVFREIARDCVEYLRIPPDMPGDQRDGARPNGAAPATND